MSRLKSTLSFGLLFVLFFTHGCGRFSFEQAPLPAKIATGAAVAAGVVLLAESTRSSSATTRYLDVTFTSRFGKNLPTIYFDYVKKRAVEHFVASQLRAGEPDPWTLNTSLFHAAAMSIGPADPEELATNDIVGTFKTIAPFSSRAVAINASKQVDNINAYFTLTPSFSTVGSELRAILYRNGVGTELTSGLFLIPDFGKNANDSFNQANEVFEKSRGSATLAYTTPAITHADDNSEVGFSAGGGSIYFTNYSAAAAGRLIGTYSAEVTGTQRTDNQGHSRVLTGNISGYFDVALTNQ